MNTTIFSTIELAAYMNQPFKTFQRLYEVLQLLPNEGSHIKFSVKRLIKDYFSPEAKQFNLIAYKETMENHTMYFIDISHEDEQLADLKKKHMIRGIINSDGTVNVKVC